MRLRNPLIALVILVGLAVYVYFIEIKGGEKRQKEKEASELLLPFKPEQATSLVLTRGGERVRLDKAAGAWRIREPVPADPDTDSVNRLLDSLAELRIAKDLGPQTDLAPFGLKNPVFQVELQATGPKPLPPLSLGEDVPTGGGTYGRQGDSGPVLLVSGAASVSGTTFFSLRDKTLLKFDPARISGVRLVRDKEEVVLAKKGGKWRITTPILAPADDSGVTDLLSALERLSASEFVEEKPAPEAFPARGLRPPRLMASLSGEEWTGEKSLSFGNAEGGKVYSLQPSSGALIRVPDSAEAKLKTPVLDLRRKEALPLSRFEIGRVRVTGLEKGTLEFRKKSDGEWSRVTPSPGDLGNDSMENLLTPLGNLKAESFVDPPVGEARRWGLASPTARLEVWKQGQEDGAAEVLLVGGQAGKGKIAMRWEAWPSVLVIPEDLWTKATEAIRKAAEEKPKSAAAPQTIPAAAAGKGSRAATSP